MHPDVRAELKRAHPELTDATIDEYEQLTSLRTSLDPSTAGGRIAAIDARREALLHAHMPDLAAIHNAMIEKRRVLTGAANVEPRVTVRTVPDRGAREG